MKLSGKCSTLQPFLFVKLIFSAKLKYFRSHHIWKFVFQIHRKSIFFREKICTDSEGMLTNSHCPLLYGFCLIKTDPFHIRCDLFPLSSENLYLLSGCRFPSRQILYTWQAVRLMVPETILLLELHVNT